MENDSSRSGYHQPQPASAGHNLHRFVKEADSAWGDDEWDNDVIEESTHSLTPHIKLIWAQAYDDNGQAGAIGLNGTMPWHLREDMQYFKDLTVTHPVIMGRKTWESLGEKYRPLPNRDNYVVSRNPQYKARGATVVSSFDTAIELASQPAIPDDGVRRDEIWIIGGAQLYREALPYAEEIYITDIDMHVEADAYAPDMVDAINNGEWTEEIVQDWRHPHDEKSSVARYRFRILRRTSCIQS